MTLLGPLVAAGRTSDVYAFGVDTVIKVPRPEVPPHWAAMEAQFTTEVRRLGAPAPEVHDVVEIDGRDAIVFERIDGESMWQRMLASPSDVTELARQFADIHRRILSSGLPARVPGLVERMCVKIDDAHELPSTDRAEACAIVDELPSGAALLHGDMHPGNVLMSDDGPVIIDWFDAAIGHPIADVVRSSLLMRPTDDPEARPHLPDASCALLDELHDAYVTAMTDVLDVPLDLLRAFESVVAVSRLAEDAQPDSSMLVALWQSRTGEAVSPLVAAVSRSGAVTDL